MRILRTNPHDETAWLWLVETIATREERIRVLETCLRFNPHSQSARKGLAALNAAQPVTEPVVRAGQTAVPRGSGSAIAAAPRRYASPKRRQRVLGIVGLLLLLAALAFVLAWSLSGPKSTRAQEAISVRAEPVQTMLPAHSGIDEATPIAGRSLLVSPARGYTLDRKTNRPVRFQANQHSCPDRSQENAK